MAGTGGQNTCGVQTFTASGRPADLLVILDRSASMQETPLGASPTPGDPSKWSLVTPALGEVITATNAIVSWGLKTFPEAGPECGGSTVTTTIDVPVAPANATAVNAAIAATTPDGNGTPTAAAVDVGRDYLQARTSANAKYLLLVTDGLPSCAGTTLDSAMAATAAVKSVTKAADAGINTFVVGLVSTSTAATDTLNKLAIAGGEPRLGANPLTTRFHQALSKDELIAALRTITGQVVSCRFPLSSPPPVPDNVTVSVAGTPIPHDPSGANGWEYASTAHTEVRVYGSSCDTIRAAGSAASVQIVYGCTGAGGAGGSGTLLMSDDFEDGNADGWLTDSATTGSAWAVVSDGANHVYQESADINTRVWSVGGAVGWTDQRVEAKVKFATLPAPPFTSSAGGMVAARVQDLSNQYFVTLGPDGRVGIYIRNAGSASVLAVNSAASRTPLAAGNWYTLALAVRGTTLTAYLDGTAVVTTTDTSFAAGGIGVGTDHITASFDDVKVTLP